MLCNGFLLQQRKRGIGLMHKENRVEGGVRSRGEEREGEGEGERRNGGSSRIEKERGW